MASLPVKIRIELFLLLFGLTLITFTLHPVVSSDGAARYELVNALLNHQEIPKIKYSLIQPLLTLPVAYIATYLGFDAIKYVAYFNFSIFIIFGLIISVLVSRIYSPRMALRFLLLLLSASMLPHHLGHYFGEVLSAMFIVTGFLLLIRGSKLPVIALMSLGVANTPVMIVPITITIGSLFLMKVLSPQRLATLLMSVALAVLFVLIDTYLKFGFATNPYLSELDKGFQTVMPYSGRPGFSYPLFFGVLSIVFSFGKGLLFFIPALVLLFNPVILQKLRLNASLSAAIFIFCASLILVYSKWWAWYGGNFWGPRFFLILIFPATLALAVYVDEHSNFTPARTILFSIVLILSTWVAINGYVFGQNDLDVCWTNNYQLEFLCWYAPEFSALWRPFVSQTIHAGHGKLIFGLWQFSVLMYFLFSIISREYKAGLIQKKPIRKMLGNG